MFCVLRGLSRLVGGDGDGDGDIEERRWGGVVVGLVGR